MICGNPTTGYTNRGSSQRVLGFQPIAQPHGIATAEMINWCSRKSLGEDATPLKMGQMFVWKIDTPLTTSMANELKWINLSVNTWFLKWLQSDLCL